MPASVRPKIKSPFQRLPPVSRQPIMDSTRSERVHFGSIEESEERRRNQNQMSVDEEEPSGVSLEDLGKCLWFVVYVRKGLNSAHA